MVAEGSRVDAISKVTYNYTAEVKAEAGEDVLYVCLELIYGSILIGMCP